MNDNITNTNFEIINKAKDYFFSVTTEPVVVLDNKDWITPKPNLNRYEIVLFAYLYHINAINIIQNANDNIPNIMFTKMHNDGIQSYSIVANITDPKLQEVYDILTDKMQTDNQYIYKVFSLFQSVDKSWFDDNFFEIFDLYFLAAQSTINMFQECEILTQPKEFTKLISTLSEFKGGSVYNPFAPNSRQ